MKSSPLKRTDIDFILIINIIVIDKKLAILIIFTTLDQNGTAKNHI
jgi:hypothetical protein